MLFFMILEVLSKFLEHNYNHFLILYLYIFNSNRDKLLVSILLTSFSGKFSISFIWGMFFFLPNLVVSLCLFLCIRWISQFVRWPYTVSALWNLGVQVHLLRWSSECLLCWLCCNWDFIAVGPYMCGVNTQVCSLWRSTLIMCKSYCAGDDWALHLAVPMCSLTNGSFPDVVWIWPLCWLVLGPLGRILQVDVRLCLWLALESFSGVTNNA